MTAAILVIPAEDESVMLGMTASCHFRVDYGGWAQYGKCILSAVLVPTSDACVTCDVHGEHAFLYVPPVRVKTARGSLMGRDCVVYESANVPQYNP